MRSSYPGVPRLTSPFPWVSARAARRAFALVLVAACAGWVPAAGDPIIVDGSHSACSDAGPGSEAIPYCTISAAVAAHNGPGVTIRVRPAVYVGGVSVPKSGAAGNPFVLQADGPVTVRNGTVSLSGRSWVVLDGFTVRNGSILSGGASSVVITHNVVDSGGTIGISVSNVSNLLLASNSSSNCITHGVRLRDVTNSTIEDNAAFRNGNGIALTIDSGSNSGNVVRRNRFYDNIGTGLYFQAGVTNNASVQNLAWGNEHGIQHTGSSGNRHVGDVVWGNTDDGISLKNFSTGNSFSNCIVGDNGLGHTVYALYADTTSTTGLVSDDNVFWNANG